MLFFAFVKLNTLLLEINCFETLVYFFETSCIAHFRGSEFFLNTDFFKSVLILPLSYLLLKNFFEMILCAL